MQVTIDYHFEDGTWYAVSDDLPGYSASATTLVALRRKVHDGIELVVEGAARVVEHFASGAAIVESPHGVMPFRYPSNGTEAVQPVVTLRPARVRLRLEPQRPSAAVA
jgi:predicted RNase H-like HicB family nuclease